MDTVVSMSFWADLAALKKLQNLSYFTIVILNVQSWWINAMISKLPEPDSEELKTLVRGSTERRIYSVLFKNIETKLSMSMIRNELNLKSGQQEHLNRRMRDLYKIFDIERTREGSETFYKLVGMREQILNTDVVDAKTRAWVLRDQRCAQCGKTPSEDKIKLHVDHKIPRDWDGTNNPENLQALCSECNQGKKNLYATYDDFKELIKSAANLDEPHMRIGELLKAFGGRPVPSDLIDIVAKSKQYQADWQKRLRELRVLGWEYEYSKKKIGNKVQTFFSLKHFEPWPKGNIASEIRRRERRRKQSPGD